MGNTIVKDNALIEASHRLGEVEQRLILLAILKARNQCNTIEQLQGKELIICANDYARTYNISQDMAYKALKQAVLGLFEAKWGYKYTNDKGNKVVRYERFTQSAMYIEGEGVVSFKFADAMIPRLVELERKFTTYEIEQVAKLPSQYSIRLYEIFMQCVDKKKTCKGWLDISLDDLRFRLGLLTTEYKTMSNFKARVLDYSIDEINKKTDLTVSYKQQKQGRKIVGFNFQVEYEVGTKPKRLAKKSKSDTDDNGRDQNTPDMFDGLTDEERQVIKLLRKEQQQKFMDYSDEERQEILKSVSNYLNKKGKVTEQYRKNIFNKAFEDGWGLAEKRQAEQDEQAERDAKQAKSQAKKAKLKQAQSDFERILADEELIIKYIEYNGVTEKTLGFGVYQQYFKDKNYVEFFKGEKRNFDNLVMYERLNLSFLDILF